MLLRACDFVGREFSPATLGSGEELYPASADQVAAFQMWVRKELEATATADNVGAKKEKPVDVLKAKCAAQGAAVLGIAGLHLVVPTVTTEGSMRCDEILAVVERRTGLTAEELKQDEMLTQAAAEEAGDLDAARGRKEFEPWQYLPPLVYAFETMQFFGMESVQLVESTLTRGMLVDETRWSTFANRDGGGGAGVGSGSAGGSGDNVGAASL